MYRTKQTKGNNPSRATAGVLDLLPPADDGNGYSEILKREAARRRAGRTARKRLSPIDFELTLNA